MGLLGFQLRKHGFPGLFWGPFGNMERSGRQLASVIRSPALSLASASCQQKMLKTGCGKCLFRDGLDPEDSKKQSLLTAASDGGTPQKNYAVCQLLSIHTPWPVVTKGSERYFYSCYHGWGPTSTQHVEN